jgi:hypothetical protein
MSPAFLPKMRWWVAPAALLALSALSVVAIFMVRPQLGRAGAGGTGAVNAVTWSTDCGGGQANNFGCLEKHYQTLVATRGVAAAFIDIKDAYNRSTFVKGNCHQLVHIIGRAAGTKYGDVSKAYEQGDNFCWSGYYHGVMEAVMAQIGYDQIKPKINTICATVSRAQKYSFYHYNCVHGLGHGIMAVNNSELYDSLTTCDALTDPWERESCYGGVFMENIMDEINPNHTTKYLKKDDLMYPCNAVNTQYKQQCYLMQTSHALQDTGYDFDKVFGLCDNVEADFRQTCYQSLGRDASGSTISDPVRTRDLCLKGRDFDARNNCLIGAVKDFISYYHANEQGMKLCAALDDARLRESCTATAKSYDVGTK